MPKPHKQTDAIDPEPVAIIALVVATISAVCDIANTAREARRRADEKREVEARRNIGVALVDLEARLLDVKSSFDELSSFLGGASLEAPVRFGSTSVHIESSYYAEFYREVQRLLTRIKRLHGALEATVWRVYESGISWEGSPIESLIDLREECNRILFESRSIGEALSRIDSLIDDAVIAARKIRVWLGH